MTALYRRYRSAVLGDLVGQDPIVRTLSSELRLGRLAHAYLFAGIRGTGKTSTARIIARAVNCLEPEDGEPCNRCSACREILDGSAVDVLEIDAASNRGIDEMRDLRERVRYLPARLAVKVYIIDEAHMLTSEAWNAFLKTLEEPPGHVLFILCTTEPHKVPETVRSRVQRFDFQRVTAAAITAHLTDISAREQVDVDPAATRLIALAAQGSVRDALSLLDQCLATGERPLTLPTCRAALGLADPGLVRHLLEGLASSDAAAALRAATAALDAGADPRQLLREGARLARAAELRAVGLGDDLGLDPEEDELCRRLAGQRPEGFWLRVLQEAGATELELRQPVDARLQVEAWVLRLSRERSADTAVQLSRLEARLRAVELRLEGGPGAAGPPAAPRRWERPSAVRPAPGPSGAGAAPPSGGTGPSRADRGRGQAGAPAPRAATADPGSEPAAPERSGDPGMARSGPAPRAGGEDRDQAATPHPAEAVGLPAPAAGEASAPAAPAGEVATGGPAGAALTSVKAWEGAWPALVAAVNRRDRVFAGVIRGSRPLEADAERLVVGAPLRFYLTQLRNPTKVAVLEEAVAAVAGAPRMVSAAMCAGGGATGSAAEAEPAGPSLTEQVLSTFDGSRVIATRLLDHAREPEAAG